MTTLITNPTSTHRARIVADAVVSAYIHEISPSAPAAERARARTRERRPCTEASARTARPASSIHVRRWAPAPRRRSALEAGI